MKNRFRIRKNRLYGTEVSDISEHGMNALPMIGLEPPEVRIDSGTAEIVENDHLFAIPQVAVGEIAANEAAASDDNNGRASRSHDISPRS
jgi:hypothetical protein